MNKTRYFKVIRLDYSSWYQNFDWNKNGRIPLGRFSRGRWTPDGCKGLAPELCAHGWHAWKWNGRTRTAAQWDELTANSFRLYEVELRGDNTDLINRKRGSMINFERRGNYKEPKVAAERMRIIGRVGIINCSLTFDRGAATRKINQAIKQYLKDRKEAGK